MSNLTEHQCKGKCPEFKEEQCNHCLVQDFSAKQWFDMPNHHLIEQSQACSLEQIEKREFDLGLAPDEAYVKTGYSESAIDSDFLVGDVVVVNSPKFSDGLFTITNIVHKPHFHYPVAFLEDANGQPDFFGLITLRRATTAELHAKRRLNDVEHALGEVS